MVPNQHLQIWQYRHVTRWVLNMRKIHSFFAVCPWTGDRPFSVIANMFVSSNSYICTNQSALPIHKNHHLTYHDTVIYLIHNYLTIINTAFFDILLHAPAQMGFSCHVSRCEKDSAVAIPRLVAKCGAKDTTTPQRSGVPNGQSDLWHDFEAGCELCKYVV